METTLKELKTLDYNKSIETQTTIAKGFFKAAVDLTAKKYQYSFNGPVDVLIYENQSICVFEVIKSTGRAKDQRFFAILKNLINLNNQQSFIVNRKHHDAKKEINEEYKELSPFEGLLLCKTTK